MYFHDNLKVQPGVADPSQNTHTSDPMFVKSDSSVNRIDSSTAALFHKDRCVGNLLNDFIIIEPSEYRLYLRSF